MPWGAVAGAAITAATAEDGGGGGQTASKEPWANAVPWLNHNIDTGRNLQNALQASPFSASQMQAYNNQFGDSDYFRSLSGSVLGQLNGFKPFDRNNPDARPTPFQFPSRQPGQMQSASSPFGGPVGSMQATNPFVSAVLSPPPAPAPAPAVAPTVPYDWTKDPKYASGYHPDYPMFAFDPNGGGF